MLRAVDISSEPRHAPAHLPAQDGVDNAKLRAYVERIAREKLEWGRAIVRRRGLVPQSSPRDSLPHPCELTGWVRSSSPRV